MEGSSQNQKVDMKMARDVKKAKVEDVSMNQAVKEISNELDKQMEKYITNLTDIESLSNRCKTQIRKQREEIKNFFDKLEKDMLLEVDAIRADSLKRQDSNFKKLELYQKDFHNLMSDIGNQMKTEEKLRQEITVLKEQLVSLGNENTITHYKYQQSKKIQEVLQITDKLGTIQQKHKESKQMEETAKETATETNQTGESVNAVETESNEQELETDLEHSIAIHTRTKDDSQQSTVTGLCTVQNGFIAVVDCGNKSVKMINTKENKIVSVLPMESDPHDITKVNENQLAVTLFYKKQIQFISVDKSKSLSLMGNISADNPCYGIFHSNNQLTVTQSDKTEILDMKGEVLQHFASDSAGNQLFKHAKYLTMSPDYKTIYVSDYTKNTVTGLSTDGEVKAIYKERELQMPYGVTVDSAGNVYVCGYSSSTIHKLSADLSSGKVILDESDGIVMPQSIAFCARQNRIYVGMWCNDTIRVYQL